MYRRMTDTSENLSLAVVGRIAELRSRIDDATTDLNALFEAIDSPNEHVKRQVRVCLRGAIEHMERAFDELEDAESAAAGTFESKA